MTHQENLTNYYSTFHKDGNLPPDHIKYLKYIKNKIQEPKVIYDIGSAVLHWTKNAKEIWPNSKIIAFEAVKEVEDFYKNYGIDHALEVFTDIDNKEIIFYEDLICLGGNSYYKENSKYSAAAEKIYNENSAKKRIGFTIDTIVEKNNFLLPDFVKIDVQGAEIDILKGMKNTLKTVKNLIVEIQHVEYNVGALQKNESFEFIKNLGFELVSNDTGNDYFCGNGPDADYHFIKI
jgi:FkbM family methyltransferase